MANSLQATSPTLWGPGSPPYAGLKPSTPQWMEVWKKYPQIQEEMLQYQALLAMGIDPIESPNPSNSSAPVFRISNSAIESSAKCSTQALLRYGYNVVAPGEQFPLVVGNAIHKALAHKYKTNDIPKAWEIFVQSYPEGIPPSDHYTRDNCFTIFQHFIEQAPMPYIIHPTLVELWFEQKLMEDEKGVIMLCGRQDLIPQDKATKAFYVADHKSTKRITDWWLKKFRLSSQLTGYVWAAQRFMGTTIPGVIIDGIELPVLPGSANLGMKCKSHSVPYSECRKFHPNHQQFICERPPWMVDNWKLDAIFQAKRLRDLITTYAIAPEGVKYVRQQGTQDGACVFCEYVDFCLVDRPIEWIGDKDKLPKVENLVQLEG